jgi:hypothetical protein
MTIFLYMRRRVFAAAVMLVPVLAAAPAFALSKVSRHSLSDRTTAAVIPVHNRWNDDDNYGWRHHPRNDRHHRRDVVDAPFTRVETNHRVIVDAPFAHVTVTRRGRHVVAPFVDLWLPR